MGNRQRGVRYYMIDFLYAGAGNINDHGFWDGKLGPRQPPHDPAVRLAWDTGASLVLPGELGTLGTLPGGSLSPQALRRRDEVGFRAAGLRCAPHGRAGHHALKYLFQEAGVPAWLRDLGPTRAIVRGGLFFAAVHILTLGGASFEEGVQMALVAFLIRIPVGLALGWVFVHRGSLYAAIGLHAAYNAIPVILALAATS